MVDYVTIEQDFGRVNVEIDIEEASAAFERIRAEVKRLRAQNTSLMRDNEHLRAVLSKGCERDPLHQCPNCRQALEETT
jgi:regulator of replication initiation timing